MSQKNYKANILLRVRLLHAFFVIVGIVLVCRLVWIQTLDSTTRTNAGNLKNSIIRTQKVVAHRGAILARGGEPFASSIYKYQVEMDFGSEGFDSLNTYKQQSDSLAKLLSAYFKDRSAKQYSELFSSQRKKNYKLIYKRDSVVLRDEGWLNRMMNRWSDEEYINIKIYDTIRKQVRVPIFPRYVDYAEWQELRHYPILNWNMGMTYHLDSRDFRIYPQGELASRTIGKIMGDKGNDFGIEHVYNDVLTGTDGEIERQRIARGFSGRVIGGESIEPRDGSDVVTTLDIDIQDVANRALREQLIRQNGIWGTSIVMEVESGDILAMVNLKRMSKGNYQEGINYALGARMEPGSTFKLAAAIALLDEADMSPDQVYDTGNGRPVKLGKTEVVDSHAGFSEVDIKTAISQSLNGYFGSAIYYHYKDNPKRYTDVLQKIGIDKRVGFEAFGEAQPILPTPGSKIWWGDRTLVNVGYGYGVELAPIHTLTLYNAIANDGCMVAPRLVKEIRRDNSVEEQFPVRILNPKICSSHTLNTIRECLEETAISGTASSYLGHFKSFTVGAKTGTAQFAQGNIRYGDGYYLGSMVSYMPADKPKYTIMTAIFTRRGNGPTYYGAGLAGTVQREIIQHIYNLESDWFDRIDDTPRLHAPTRIKGGTTEQVKQVSKRVSPHSMRGDKHSEWTSVSIDSLYVPHLKELEVESSLMPNVVGMGLKDALYILESAGLKVSFSGKGRVIRQSLRAGTRIKEGNHVTLVLR